MRVWCSVRRKRKRTAVLAAVEAVQDRMTPDSRTKSYRCHHVLWAIQTSLSSSRIAASHSRQDKNSLRATSVTWQPSASAGSAMLRCSEGVITRTCAGTRLPAAAGHKAAMQQPIMAVTPSSDPSRDSRTPSAPCRIPGRRQGPRAFKSQRRALGEPWGGFWPLSGSSKKAPLGPFGHAALGLSWL